MLQFSDVVSDFKQSPVAGDLLGCADVIVVDSNDVDNIEIELNVEVPRRGICFK
jgi:hypothetical protein